MTRSIPTAQNYSNHHMPDQTAIVNRDEVLEAILWNAPVCYHSVLAEIFYQEVEQIGMGKAIAWVSSAVTQAALNWDNDPDPIFDFIVDVAQLLADRHSGQQWEFDLKAASEEALTFGPDGGGME